MAAKKKITRGPRGSAMLPKGKHKKAKRIIKTPRKRSGKKRRPEYARGHHPNSVKHRFDHESAVAGGKKSRRGPAPQLTYYIRKALFDAKTEGLSKKGQKLIHRIITDALEGEVALIKELLNRMDGKVPDKVEATVQGSLEGLTDEQLDQIIANGEDDNGSDS